MTIACVGITVLDRVFRVAELPREGGKYVASEYFEIGGGPAATAAVAISKLGSSVDFIGRAGRDSVADAMIKEFNRNLMLNEFVYLSSDSLVADKDEDGNKVRYLYRAPDGLFLNLEIIRQGYAVAASGYDYKHKDLFGFYESKARGDKKGVYSLTAIKK